MTEERVLVTRDGAVAHVVLNRPDKRNGLDIAMFEALIATGDELRQDKSLRAVVLSGAGKAFCAGLDFQSFMSGPEIGQKLLARPETSPANLAQRAAWVWQEVPVPVIAAVHGVAFGGGFQLAMGCDLRFVTEDAQLSVMEIRWGLIPDMSISQTLFHHARPDVAAELIWTGRRVPGPEAVQLGLATRVVADPVAAAHEAAQAIAQRSPEAIRAGKRLLQESRGLSVADAFKLETELQLPLLGSANQLEAVSANFAKRAPVFTDPE